MEYKASFKSTSTSGTPFITIVHVAEEGVFITQRFLSAKKREYGYKIIRRGSKMNYFSRTIGLKHSSFDAILMVVKAKDSMDKQFKEYKEKRKQKFLLKNK